MFKMHATYLVLLLTTALFKEMICGVSISFCAPIVTDIFPFPGNCTRYISCNQGQATIFSCTHGSTFNPESNRCDYEHGTDNCQNSIGNLKDLRLSCPQGSSNSFPHPFDCKKYIACSHGLTYVMNCSAGTKYNFLKSICDWPYNVPACSGNLGNGYTLRGDVTLSSINLDAGSISFETKKNVGNEHQTNQLTENQNCSTDGPTYHQSGESSHDSIQNPSVNHYPSINFQITSNTHLQSIQNEHYGVNKPSNYQSLLTHGYYSTPNKTPNQNPTASYQTDSKHNQITTPTQSSSHQIIFPTEKPQNEEDEQYDIDIRMKDDQLNGRSNTQQPRNGRAGTALSFDQVLAINNLLDSKTMANNSKNKIENVQKQSVSKSDALYNNYPSTNQLNENKDYIGLSSQIHGKIVNSPNNWFNSKPLEPIDNYIDANLVTEQVNNGKLVVFKEEIESVSSSSETPLTKIIVENSPSLNLINYNYVEDYSNDRVQIDQDYSKIRNQTVSPRTNNNNVRKGRTIQKLHDKSTQFRKLFRNESTDDTFLSTLFVTPFKSESNNQHVEVINQLSGQGFRLKGGSGAHHGYIEVRRIGLVGQCDNSWNLMKAHEICKNLGYKRGAKRAWKGPINDAQLPLSSLKSHVFCQDDKSEFHTCKFKNISECNIEHDTIGVECFLDSSAYCSENDVPFHKNCYHLINSSLDLNHENAIQYCSLRNSSLLYITAQDENDFISEWLTQKYPQVESIMTAGIGFTTMARTIWIWQDSAKSLFNFKKWWPGWRNEKVLPPSVESSPSCMVMKNKFPCYDQPNLNCKTDGYFFWDVEDCTSSMKENHYICKRPYNNIIL